MSTPTPTSLPQQHGLAARMGRWSASHWKTATFGWLAFVVVAFALGGLVGTKNVDSNAGPGESGRMQKILDAGFKQPAGESVLIESRSARVGDVAFTAAIKDVIGAVSKLTVVQQVHRGAISKNQHAARVDYSMFYLKRERQERAAGRSAEAALEAAAATSGRSVLISGLTVMAAMAGLLLTGDSIFASLAVATILVVAVAVLGSLTVLPALLSRLGDKVDRLRVPLVGRHRRDDGEGRFWGAIVDRVLRRPALSAALAAGLLLALAAPALQLHLAPQGAESFPKSLEVIKTYERMQQAFPGSALPANVVVKAPSLHTPAMRAAIAQLERRALASGRAFEPIILDVNKQGTVANITVPIAGNGTDAASNAAFHLLRDTIVPETVGAVPNTEAGVTGLTAAWKDQAAALKSNLLPVVAFVLVLAFALMLIAFRSLVIAAKAILLNLLSVGAAYGVLVLVFQHRLGKGLLGAGSADGIEAVVPLLLLVILFGLSMDYHVFIISRIRETFDRGATMDDAVRHGIKSTAGVVTSAAIVMVCVFAVFGTLSMPFFKQFGVGLAAAILIDATIVRAVLLPATMKLLGDWNWYLPKWLEWLPQSERREPEAAPKAKPTPASA